MARLLAFLLLLPGPGFASAAPPLPARLRETGLYGSDGRIAADVLPFSPQYPLWSDGAEKRRWIRLPRGSAIDARDPDHWVFPVGTRLWKELGLGRRLETRMLERTRAGWRFASYVWNDDQTDALLAPAAGVPEGIALPGGGRWIVPGTTDCRICHEGQQNHVLGFEALQLSSGRDDGAPHARAEDGDVHLEDLVARGLLRDLPPALLRTPPRIVTDSPEERAALGYLHANCGICHNAEGPLASIGMDLLQSVAEGPRSTERVRSSLLGVQASHVLPGAELRVAPGEPMHSVLLRRMATRDPADRMPPLGTEAPDRDALALVERWIHSLADRRTP